MEIKGIEKHCWEQGLPVQIAGKDPIWRSAAVPNSDPEKNKLIRDDTAENSFTHHCITAVEEDDFG